MHQMTTLHILLLIVSTESRKCNAPNHNDSYHPTTDTCLRILPSSVTWQQAYDKCKSVGGDHNTGNLVRILAEDMSMLVKDILHEASYKDVWIGLRYVHKIGYRWAGFEDEPVTFYKWEEAMSSKTDSLNTYSVATGEFWKEVSETYRSMPLCQFSFYKISDNQRRSLSKLTKLQMSPTRSLTGMNRPSPIFNVSQLNSPPEQISAHPNSTNLSLKMYCPSNVQKESTTVYIPLKYYSLEFDETQCYVTGIEKPVASCRKDDIISRRPTTRPGFSLVMVRKDMSILSYKVYSKRPPDGKWSCQTLVNKEDHQSVKSHDFCVFQFVCPPKSLKCHYKVLSFDVLVSCTVLRIYPRAYCEFSCKQRSHDFQRFDYFLHVFYDHQPYKDPENDNMYFKSVCSIVITTNASLDTFCILRVKVYPGVASSSSSEFLTYDLKIYPVSQDLSNSTEANLFLSNSTKWMLIGLFGVLLLITLLISFLWLIAKLPHRKRDRQTDVIEKNDHIEEYIEECEETYVIQGIDMSKKGSKFDKLVERLQKAILRETIVSEDSTDERIESEKSTEHEENSTDLT